MSANHIYALVLAAGKSSRYGASKQLETYDGISLVARAVRLAEQTCGSQSVLVLGNDWRSVAASCSPLQGFFVVNPEFTAGISTSIAAGMRSICHVADAVLVMLADQPLITTEHLQALASDWERNPGSIIASHYSNTLGPPAIFPQKHFAALEKLEGDKGARQILQTAGDEVRKIDFADGAVDIDTPDDLRNLS